MNCDRIAHAYSALEYAAFGRGLERHRFRYLSELKGCEQALLLGDGDGRFCSRLLQANRCVRVDVFEASSKMVSLSRKRIRQGDLHRVHFEQSNVLHATFAGAYDLIVTNFFLDCFSTAEATRIVASVRGACRPGAYWVVSEFAQPEGGWAGFHARLWLGAMYAFFGIATGLTTRRLPEYRAAMVANAFALESRICSRAGLICSELWRL